MCEDIRHCGECGAFIPICKAEAESIIAAMPHVGKWQRYRDAVIVAVGYALKQHGICAYLAEIVDGMGIACTEFWVKDIEAERE